MFDLLRDEIHTVRNLQLVLCVNAEQDRMAKEYEGLKQVVAAEQAAGGFDYPSSHPLVVRTSFSPPSPYYWPEG